MDLSNREGSKLSGLSERMIRFSWGIVNILHIMIFIIIGLTEPVGCFCWTMVIVVCVGVFGKLIKVTKFGCVVGRIALLRNCCLVEGICISLIEIF